ncbi:MAG: aminoglycoside phosphotransferase [Deltaproteobacteria bacterium]|nr:MAG: aminoglycoside phosphotransferase [Deltaproteobacteria bacterium]
MSSEENIREIALSLLRDCGVLSPGDRWQSLVLRPLPGDGSQRRFWRLFRKDRSLCLLCAPESPSEAGLREARATFFIGRHLQRKGCAVPGIFGWDASSGLVIFEDLGSSSLQSIVGSSHDTAFLKDLYREVVARLVHLQFRGVEDFDPDWCWQSTCYDKKLMLEGESRYFLEAFWKGLLHEQVPAAVEKECLLLADYAARAAANVFLHRDFQSRNIMVRGAEPCFIDYQGGRLGPPGYDLASLLIDPYVCLEQDFQEEIVAYYLQVAAEHIVDTQEFLQHYTFLALQRNLQIIGAFSFLFRIRKKEFFFQYIRPSLLSAARLLRQPACGEFLSLKRMIDLSLLRLNGL